MSPRHGQAGPRPERRAPRHRATRRRSGAPVVALFPFALLLVAAQVSGLVWPQVRHDLRGTLVGDAPGAGGPVLCRAGAGLTSAGRKADHLTLERPCATAIGRVVLILHAPDGDTHISLLPDRGYWPLLDGHNYAFQGGTLVVEVAPADRGGVAIPPLGAHVRVTGALVADRAHGWREVHPAWQIVRVPS